MKRLEKAGIFIIVGVALISALYLLATVNTDFLKKEDADGVEVVAFKVNEGYAYKILVHDKVYILQEYIPVVTGNTRFCSEEDAYRTGELVKNKLLLNKNPSITMEDLQRLNIKLKCF